jgi:hypothetical protein
LKDRAEHADTIDGRAVAALEVADLDAAVDHPQLAVEARDCRYLSAGDPRSRECRPTCDRSWRRRPPPRRDPARRAPGYSRTNEVSAPAARRGRSFVVGGRWRGHG